MGTFKAYRSFQENGQVSSRFVDLNVDDLDPGDVVIKSKYSTINYKDALSYASGKIMQKFPTIAGIDVAGTVETSADPRFKRGDRVIVHSYDFGVGHDGGYSEYVRVPGDWVVRRPADMTAFDAMTLGTAGFTAALAVELMQLNGLTPERGPVVVSGATGGVGGVAIDILAKLGYQVSALTGKSDRGDYLRSLGAHAVIDRKDLNLERVKPLDKATWAGGVDNLGGNVLAWMLSTTINSGMVSSVGLAADFKLSTTVMPFILRGVRLLGTDSVNCPMPLRQKLWDRLAKEWKPERVQSQVHTVDMVELPAMFDRYLKADITGRYVVKIA